jgi:hypothetical protein
MRILLTLMTLAFAGALGGWGLWLLTTPDPDGGRHPVGALMLAIAAVSIAAAVAIDRFRRR